MDLTTRIEQLEALINEAKSMPLSSSVLLNKDELLEVVREMRESIPEEIKQARWVVKDREDLLMKARDKADEILAEARAEQDRMLSKEGVVQAAAQEADRLLAVAQEDAHAAQLEAEDYVDAKLAQFEIVLKKVVENMEKVSRAMIRTSEQVEAGRDKLRETAGGHPAEALSSESDGDATTDSDLTIEEAPDPEDGGDENGDTSS
jgi:cell division septum initiation protein DivIVA